jgi:hypothetical protein
MLFPTQRRNTPSRYVSSSRTLSTNATSANHRGLVLVNSSRFFVAETISHQTGSRM